MPEEDLKKVRTDKLKELEEKKINPYPNNYEVTHKTRELIENFEKLEKDKSKVKTAGRLMLIRMHGKAGFSHIKDDTGMIQIYVKLDFIGDEKLKIFKLLDIGDIIGVEGEIFKTHTEEITIKVDDFTLLSK